MLLRSVHIPAAGIVLGGLFLGYGHPELAPAAWVALGSGFLMMLTDFVKGPRFLVQGGGLALMVKLALLAVGFFFFAPDRRFGWYLAATLVASVGSHMPGALRHWDALAAPGGRRRRSPNTTEAVCRNVLANMGLGGGPVEGNTRRDGRD